MNKSAFTTKIVALILVIASTLAIASCDKLPFFGNDNNTPPVDDQQNPNPECLHQNVIDGKCFDCDKIFLSTLNELNFDLHTGMIAPDNTVATQMYYTEVTVKQVINNKTGEMIVEDATGTMKVVALCSEDGTTYGNMSEKPDECDKMLIQCVVEKSLGTWQIKTAFLVNFEAVEAPIKVITIAEAIEICKVNADETAERYYIRGTVTRVSNPAYGEMYIADETGEILVYNTKNSDGTIGYADMSERPVKGDDVLLYCTLNNHNGTNQVKSAWVVEFTHNEPEYDPSQYTEMTLAEAREAETGEKVKVSGVVARITYANGYKPNGFILVDNTSSIYVFDGDIAGQVKIGNTVEIAAEKTYWILETEISNAEKYGYNGACQLDSAVLLSNDNGNTAFDKSWITDSTIKEIMDTPVSENITSKIFKVTALVKKVDGTGFINYYFDDIDGFTGSYTYTQCNGGDFSWLDQFDNKFCTVYIVALNAKSSASGCVWRFLPVEVIDEGYTFDINDAAEYAVKYHGVTNFLPEYTGDPAIELPAQVSSELLGFDGATLSYSSSNEEVVYFTVDTPGVVTFHGGKAGTAVVTVTGSHNGNVYSKEITITISENADVEYITVADAIATPFDTDVVVKGIVGPSLVNRMGFYLFGEDGSMIAVLVGEDAFNGLAIGNEIIVSGMRERFIKDDNYTTYGQDAIVNGQIVANYYGNHAYSTEKFISDKTLADIKALSVTESHSTEVYVVKAVVEVVETAYYTNLKITYNGVELPLYCSGAAQYSWLKQYAGQEITIEVAPCNWNDKQDNYRGCVLAVVLEDGTKVLNTLNFK